MVETFIGNYIMKSNPYTIIKEETNYQIREFKNEDPRELFWHRDKEDRIVTLLEGECKIQFDNCLPKDMIINEPIYIEKLSYHRVISQDKFIVKIEFI